MCLYIRCDVKVYQFSVHCMILCPSIALLRTQSLILDKTDRTANVSQDIGQMDMYVRMYDDLQRTEGDNPTIGIVLCSETSKDIARYSILHDNDHLFAAKYMALMPTEEELRREIEQQKELYNLQNA